jgi:hypothetical protein
MLSGELVPRHRTAPELATLLLELGRLIRARRFYKPGDARLADVFTRSLRAWRADLERRGALDLELLRQGFRERGGQGVLSHPQLGELQHDLAERGVHALRFDTSLDGESFGAFAEVLATDAGRTASRGGFAAALYALAPFGINVNGLAPEELAPGPPAEEPTAPLPLDSDTPSIAAALSSTDDLDESPPSNDLKVLAAQLDACEEPGRYLDLARRVSLHAERSFDDGEPDTCFRVAAQLTMHAQSKDSERIRDVAESFLRSLVQGARLEDLVARAAVALDEADLEAAQVLLVLGDAAVPCLLDAIVVNQGQRERERLEAVLLTLADTALPVVIERLAASDPPPKLRAAARVAGELQHPDVVAPLAGLLSAPDPSVRGEAARALGRIGSEPAVAALARALVSQTPELAPVALQALGSSGASGAVSPIERVLGKALDDRDVRRAKEAIRALGRLGRPEAARSLVALLGRRVGLGGSWLRELKSAAVAALSGLPGDDAVAALAKAARARDSQLRRAAQTALDRRAQARARVGA